MCECNNYNYSYNYGYNYDYNQAALSARSCPTPSTVSVPFPGGNETSAVAVQDGAVPQTFGVVAAGAPVVTPVGFDRLLPSLAGSISVQPVIPTPPGTVTPVTDFTGLQVTQTGLYDFTAGLSFSTVAATTGTFTAALVLFPGGIGSTTPTTITPIVLTTNTTGGGGAGSIFRGTARIPTIQLNANDVVQIQITQTAVAGAAVTATVNYAFLEIE